RRPAEENSQRAEPYVIHFRPENEWHKAWVNGFFRRRPAEENSQRAEPYVIHFRPENEWH
ncbi:hypothetical protein ABN358_21645, partial [Providencia alcalifaciens]|uniref:hypothetical protein n=1 Tax=Providencia alcalifaciens TaxID=126385 RepID=UPI0032DB6573